MKKIKIATLWIGDLHKSILLRLIEDIAKKQIELVSVKQSDIVIFGPYDTLALKRRLLNFTQRKLKNVKNILPNIDLYSLNRKIKPLRIFYSHENYPFPKIKYDFAITTHLGINKDKHLRFPLWKELIDWSHLGIRRDLNKFIKRFDNYYNIKDLISPQGDIFLKKERKICLFTSHLEEPRKTMYLNFSKDFIVDGYGAYFNNKIIHHNNDGPSKKEILKKYAFNLCPENSLYPGYYTEKVPESFLSKSLPISWMDNNVNCDFNDKSFVNLLQYSKNNYAEIISLLKEENFLKKFTNEPLLLKEPNLDEENSFIKKIISCI
jgi:hypothetical protein